MRDPFVTNLNEVNDQENFKETLRFACRKWSQDEILFNLAVLFLGFSESQPQTCSTVQGFLRCFRNPIRVPRIENWVPRIRGNWVRKIREIGSLQVHTGYLTFSLKNWYSGLRCYRNRSPSFYSAVPSPRGALFSLAP